MLSLDGSLTASVTTYAYDRRDLVTSITDPRDGLTAFTYDAIRQLREGGRRLG